MAKSKKEEEASSLRGETLQQQSVPVRARAVGGKMRSFDDLPTHDWEVKAKVLVETKRVRDEEDGTWTTKTKTRVRGRGLGITLRRLERESKNGSMAPRDYSYILDYPFYTFDNKFISEGFSAEDVALAVWNSEAMTQGTIDILAMTDEDVYDHMQRKQSPEVMAMRESMFDTSRFATVAAENERLLQESVEDVSGFKPMPVMPVLS